MVQTLAWLPREAMRHQQYVRSALPATSWHSRVMNPDHPSVPDPATLVKSPHFGEAAAHYLAGRPAYASSLFRRVAEVCGLGGRRVIDLGCGPGQIAMALASHAASILAIDPEPAMLRVARERAEGIFPSIRFVAGSSHDLAPAMGSFRLATIGRAFHWMDRPDTLRRLDTMIEAEGAVALFSDAHPEVPDNAWLREYQDLRARLGGPRKGARSQPGWRSHESVLLDSVFCRLERFSVLERRRIEPASLVARVLSMSTNSRAVLGQEGVDQLAAEVSALAERVAVGGAVTEVVESSALIGWREPA